MKSIYIISDEIQKLINQLDSGDGVDEETGEIKPELLNQLSISKNELEQKAVDYAYVIKTFDDELTTYKNEISRLTQRKKQIENNIQRMKDIVSNAMQEFGILKIEGKTVKLSFRRSERVEVVDADKLDERFLVIKKDIDKIAIKNAIKNGETLEGAELVESQNLQIK